MKIAKKVLKTIGVLLGFIVVIVLGYIIYLYAVTIELKITNPFRRIKQKQTNTNNRKTIFSNYYNTDSSHTPDFSFFMDGGKSSWAKSKKSVLKTVKNAGNLTKSMIRILLIYRP